jgi:NAD(P)-dependent dehydrogenase (short-subunit alcohol dehydrogenase family)
MNLSLDNKAALIIGGASGIGLGTAKGVVRAAAKGPDGLKDIMRDQPIGRLGRPEEIAAAVLWLCSPGAKFRDRSCTRRG